MSKPSIFSRDYEKRMKLRKRRILIVILVLLFVISVFFYFKVGIQKIVGSGLKSKTINIWSKKEPKIASKEPKIASVEEKINNDNKIEEEGIEVNLSAGKPVKAVFEVKDNKRAFKYIAPAQSSVYYDISPSKNKMVIFDEKAQAIILVNTEGSKIDITNEKYVSTMGSVFTKQSMLQGKADYIWCATPKFIDENNIAYLSQLPWIGKSTKYVWVENIQNNSHVFIQGIEGNDIKFNKIEDKGLTVVVDGKNYNLDSNGNLNQ